MHYSLINDFLVVKTKQGFVLYWHDCEAFKSANIKYYSQIKGITECLARNHNVCTYAQFALSAPLTYRAS